MENRSSNGTLIPVELGIDYNILCGHVSWELNSFRLVDFLNFTKNFITFDYESVIDRNGNREEKNKKNSIVAKHSVYFVCVNHGDAGRGIGAVNQSNYLYKTKATSKVTLHSHYYEITGNLHLMPKQTMLDLMNSDSLFTPITDAEITHNNIYYGKRPFVAVNKKHFLWLY